MTNNKIQIKQFYFENGVSDGYYVVDAKGVNWAVQPTKQLALDWYNKLNETDIKIFELEMHNGNIQVGSVIGFYTSCNADRKRIVGVVEYKEQLGFITIVDGVQYELNKLIDIEVADESNVAKAEAMSSGAIHDYAPNMMKFNFIRFCDPRLKNSYKRLSDAIKQVAKIKNIGWDTSDFIIVNSNGNSVIGFDTESFRNSLDFKNEIILWQSK